MNLSKLDPNDIIGDLYGNTVLDFWSWAFSDILSSRNRGVFAEFLIGAVLGTTENARIEWDVADHIYRGRKIKVRSASYIQHWFQKKPARIVFPLGRTRQRKIKTSIPGLSLHPKPEIYVFCLFNVKDSNEASVLDMEKWVFYPTQAYLVETRFRRKEALTLRDVRRIATPVTILQLRKAIDIIIEELNSREPKKI